MAVTVNFIEASSGDGGDPGATVAKTVDGSTVSGWVSSASVAVNSDIFLTGSSSISDKVSATTVSGYGLGAGIAGEPWDFSTSGTDEGNHIFAIINVGGTADTQANGGMGIQVADDQTTDSVGTWYVGPQSGSLSGWEYFVINPEADFDAVVAGTSSWTTTGNPAQLSGVDGMGVQWKTTNSIMGASDNCFLQTISCGVGYRVSGNTPDADFADISSYETTNRFGAMQTKSGVYLPLCKIRIGTPSGAGDTDFTDSGFTVIWQGQVLSDGSTKATALGFYGIYADEGSGTTNVDLSAGLLAAAAPEEFDFIMSGLSNGSVTLANLTLDRSRIQNVDSQVSWDGGTIKNSGQMVLSGSPTLTNLAVQNPTDGLAWYVPNGSALTNVSNIAFDGAGVGGSGNGALYLLASGTYNFVGITFANRVSGSHDVVIDSSVSGDITINVSGGGDTPTVNNLGTGGVTINANVTVTFTGMKDNTEVRIYSAGTSTELDGIENATAGTTDNRSFAASVAGSTSVDYTLINNTYEIIRVEGYTWPTTDQSLPIQQRLDRNYSNP